MNTHIRAIETRYKGYRFRSRLEARWAVFFDALDLKWEYEPEGFVTDAGPYLPDFRVWTPQGKPMWYEVKPEHVEADPKFSAFVNGLGEPDECVRATLLSGDPVDMLSAPGVTVCPRCGLIERGCFHEVYRDVRAPENQEHYLCCPMCDWETPSGGGHPLETGLLGLDFYPHKGAIVFWPVFVEQTQMLAKRARAARFEHGERG